MTDPHARTLTLDKFASLWREPKDAYDFIKADKRDEMIATMRHRAECWVAEAIGAPMPEVASCDEVDALRAIYRACMNVTANDVRIWFKERERAEKRAERVTKKGKAA